MDLVTLGLLGVIAFLLGPIAFFMVLGAKARIARIEGDVRNLRVSLEKLGAGASAIAYGQEAVVALAEAPATIASRQVEVGAAAKTPIAPASSTSPRAGAETASPPPAEAPEAERQTAPGAPERAIEAPAAFATEPPAPEPQTGAAADALAQNVAAPPPPQPRRSLEERLGARWTVWVGGVALGLGALLLVRYTIEQGLFGPGARVALAFALAAVLIGAGEWLRRREAIAIPGLALPDEATAYVPGVLTAAGAVALFGAIYASYALYHFVGPTLAFVALGLAGLATMVAASLHGPALAGLGLVGSFATPLLVSSDRPNPWAVVVYVGVVALATHVLAAARDWLWLAYGGALAGVGWAVLLRLGANDPAHANFYVAALGCLVLQQALAFAFLTGRSDAGQPQRLAAFGLAALLALAAVYLFGVDSSEQWGEASWTLTGLAVIALFAAAALRADAFAGAAAAGGVVVLAFVRLWPNSDLDGPAPSRLLDFAIWAEPYRPVHFFVFAAALSLGAASASGRRLLRGAGLTPVAAAIHAGAATLTPLGALALADMRFAWGQRSIPFALAAVALAALFVAAARQYRDGASETFARRLGLGAMAAAAIAAFAEGLVFALDGGTLTVALALAAAGAALVAGQLGLAALRWCVVGLGLAVAARLAWDPRIVGDALSRTPVFNWLLFGYGVPAVAFAFAGRVLRRGGDDIPTRVADALGILFAALLFFFEIRHAVNGGDPFAHATGLVENALMTTTALGFAIVLTRLDASRANIVFRLASLAAGGLSMALGAAGLLVWNNPFLDAVPVGGGRLVNDLLIAYLLPAVLASILAGVAVAARPLWYRLGAGGLAAALALAYVGLELRVLFHGADIGYAAGFTLSELGLDVAVCYAFAIGLAALARWIVTPRLVQASMAFAALGSAIGAVGLAGFENPVFTDDPIAGGAAFNALLIAYALPGALTLGIVNLARRLPPPVYVVAARLAAIAWLFAYSSLETRRAFQSDAIGLDRLISDGEWYAYSFVWLALGVILLAYGVWRASKEARYASAVFVVATTAKVFIFDLAGLEGALRAVSFIGLGAALIGIGLVYQKIVFAPRRAD